MNKYIYPLLTFFAILFEIGSGASFIEANSRYATIILCSGIAFSGLSVAMQITSYAKQVGISMKTYYLGKILSCIFAAFFAHVFLTWRIPENMLQWMQRQRKGYEIWSSILKLRPAAQPASGQVWSKETRRSSSAIKKRSNANRLVAAENTYLIFWNTHRQSLKKSQLLIRRSSRSDLSA